MDHHDDEPLDLARAAAAAPLVIARTGQPSSRVLGGLTGGRPLDNPVGCPTGALQELARLGSDPAYMEDDATARAETAAALLRTFGLQAYLDRVRLRQVLEVDHGTRRLSIPVHGGSARLADGDDTTTHDVTAEQPWDPWEIAQEVGAMLDVEIEPTPVVAPTRDELPQLADDLAAVMAAGATFYTPEAAATITALGDAVMRIAEATSP